MLGIHQSKDFDGDYDQFVWGEIRVIFTSFYEIQFSLTLSSLINLNCLHKPLTSCFNLKVIILQLYATSKHCWHSLSFTLASPHNTRVKKPCYCFYWSFNISPSTCDWPDADFSFVRKTIQPICLLQINFFFKFSLE